MGFELHDDDNLAGELQRLSQIRFDAVIKKNMTQIYNRGKNAYSNKQFGPFLGTPYDTGELVGSLGQSGDVVGYTKDYAPHVEFGHRTVNGGYVPGQLFLKRNVDAQRAIYIQDLRKEVRRF